MLRDFFWIWVSPEYMLSLQNDHETKGKMVIN